MALLRFAARTMFAWIFLAAGVKTIIEPGARPDLVAKRLPLPVDPELMVRVNGGLMLLGGAALALGIKSRLAAVGLAATLIPTTWVGHQYWTETDPKTRGNQQVHFNKNVTMIGGLLAYALTEDE